MRLWEALERGLLSPFHYFGMHDEVSLADLRWRRGQGYDTADLSNLYTGHDARVRLILAALQDKITEVRRMRAIGFCVSIEHAEFMARRFTEAGIPARARDHAGTVPVGIAEHHARRLADGTAVRAPPRARLVGAPVP